jgi:CTP-dependent riboflavin kinase
MKNKTSVIENKNTKYIFVVGGVISGVGKGRRHKNRSICKYRRRYNEPCRAR